MQIVKYVDKGRKITAVLTDEQYKEYEQRMKNFQKWMEKYRPGVGFNAEA